MMYNLMRRIVNIVFGKPILEKFIREIESEEDKKLFEEACKCTFMGAYRASYILIWLSCVESLKSKFKTLSRTNDPRAVEIVEEINERENQETGVDRYVLEKANEYGFINDIQKQRLENVYENRCIFAHPYSETPTRESVQSAAREVVDYVLSQKARLGETFIDEEVEKLTKEHHFLNDDDHSIENYTNNIIPKISPDCYFYFMENLWLELKEVDNVSNEKIVNRGISFSKKFLSKIDFDLVNEHSFSELILEAQQITPFILVHRKIFPALDEQSQDQVINILISKSVSSTKRRINKNEILKSIDELAKSDELRSHQLEKFKERLNKMTHGELKQLGLHTEP